jgi:glutamate-1-semialdehyde 2,1-aminomutase
VDLDGNRLLDFTGNHSVLIHGYLQPAVMDAIRRQLEKGTCFPGPTDPQLRLARHLVERIASLQPADDSPAALAGAGGEELKPGRIA